MCCSKIEDPPRFSCSNKTSNIERNLKRRNSLKPIKNITRKINIIRNSWKGINSKENLKPTHLKNINVGYAMKKALCKWLSLKKKVNIKMFEDFNDLELITDSGDISDKDSIYYPSDENLNSSN